MYRGNYQYLVIFRVISPAGLYGIIAELLG